MPTVAEWLKTKKEEEEKKAWDVCVHLPSLVYVVRRVFDVLRFPPVKGAKTPSKRFRSSIMTNRLPLPPIPDANPNQTVYLAQVVGRYVLCDVQLGEPRVAQEEADAVPQAEQAYAAHDLAQLPATHAWKGTSFSAGAMVAVALTTGSLAKFAFITLSHKQVSLWDHHEDHSAELLAEEKRKRRVCDA